MRTITCIVLLILSCISLFAQKADTVATNIQEKIKFDYFFLESLRLKQKGEMTHAFNALQYALQIDSTSAAALFESSSYYFDMNENSRGLEAMQKAVTYNPYNFEYQLALADLYRQTDHIEEAIQLYEHLLKEDPQNPELYLFLSELYLLEPSIQHINLAIEALNGLENNVGINELISMQKHQLYAAIDNKEKAVAEIEQLIAQFPTEAKYLVVLGDFYLSGQEEEKALSLYKQAAAIDPENPYYLLSMANYYDRQGKEEKAIGQIEKALNNPDLDIEVKLGVLGKYIQNLYKNNQNLEKGNLLFEKLIEQNPQNKELNLLYGQFLLNQKKIPEAKFQFQIVAEETPEELSAWKQLIELALAGNDRDEIISITDRSLVYFPDIPEFYFYKATAYLLNRETEKALTVYQEGIEHTPEENPQLLSTFYGQIGDIYYQLGNKEEAYSNYEKALQWNKNNINILNNYAYHLAKNKKDLDKAERMSRTATQLQPESATYLDTYAWVLFQKENYSLAKFYIESALAKEEKPGKVLLEHYGDILYKNGDKENAVVQWEKALSMEENDPEDINKELLIKKINDKTYYEE